MKMRVALVLGCIVLAASGLHASERLLWSSDAFGQGATESSYELEVQAAGFLSIEAVSLSFSPRLLLVGPNGDSIQGEYNPRSASIGTFVVEPGQYTLTITTPLAFPRSNESVEGHGQYLLAADLVTPSASLEEGQPQARELSSQDPLFRSETHVDWYSYVMPESGRALLQLQSSGFDTVLVVYYPDGTQDFNDDYSDSTDSGLQVRGAPGTQLLVGATSFSSGSTGAYTLTAEALTPPAGIGIYEPGMMLENPGVYSFELGSSEHSFQFRLAAGERLEVLMESDDLDSYLELLGPDGSYWSDDDGGGNLNALLTMTAPVEGVYELTARSFGLGDVLGVYTLTVAEPPLLLSIFRANGAFSGEPVSFGVPLVEGGTFTVEAGSAVIDTVLTLYGPDGVQIAEDDDGGEGTDSRLRFTAADSGTYTIEVRGYSPADPGAFMVQVYEHRE